MTLIRKQVGNTLKYLRRSIIVRFMGPDLLCYVDDVELAGFYLTVAAAQKAGKEYVDHAIESAKRVR